MDPFQDFLSRIRLDLTGAANFVYWLSKHPLLTSFRITNGTLLAGQTTVSLKHGLGRPVYAAIVLKQSVAAALSMQDIAGSTNQTDVVVQTPTALGVDCKFTLFCF